MSDAIDPDPYIKKYWFGSTTLKIGSNGNCFELFNEGFIKPVNIITFNSNRKRSFLWQLKFIFMAVQR